MVQLVCILHGGPERILVDGKGKKWHFEDHPYCGPVVVGNNGDPLENQPLAHANTAQNALIKIAAKSAPPKPLLKRFFNERKDCMDKKTLSNNRRCDTCNADYSNSNSIPRILRCIGCRFEPQGNTRWKPLSTPPMRGRKETHENP